MRPVAPPLVRRRRLFVEGNVAWLVPYQMVGGAEGMILRPDPHRLSLSLCLTAAEPYQLSNVRDAVLAVRFFNLDAGEEPPTVDQMNEAADLLLQVGQRVLIPVAEAPAITLACAAMVHDFGPGNPPHFYVHVGDASAVELAHFSDPSAASAGATSDAPGAGAFCTP